ncbi:uncharacterized protein LOC130893152 [Diorhabda carinulata]|uniref:uncharacterized protein LOC130893152 n=1 Tax=Diorhabda carinulata TaxID=1163345 RepID=UPI0025A19004|nr:uncharacterized protein LOC130893152 [Diorhabda carinulata]
MNQYTMEAFLFTPDFGEDMYLFNSSSSSDSDSNDEDGCNCESDTKTPSMKRLKTEGFLEMEVPLLNEYDFKCHFRVSKTTYEKVLELLYYGFNSDHKGGREKITPEKATFILLWYLGNQETFKQMSERFKNTMSSIHGVIQRAIKKLNSLMQEQILWPSSAENPNISQLFETISNLKGCIGVLGVSYIKIPKPKEDVANFYMCAQNYPCLALQGVITVNGKFLDIFISGGSSNTEQLLYQSNLITEMENGLLDDDYYLIGYGDYLNRRWLIQPLPNKESHIFNECHDSASRVFPESLGYLKGRFQRLQNFENRDMAIVTQCIEAACMLHNLAIDCEDDNEPFTYTDSGIFKSTNEEYCNSDECDDGGRRQELVQSLMKLET